MQKNDPIYVDRELTSINSYDKKSALSSVEINCVGLCNRSCVFCPRSNPNIYPNLNVHMTLETASRLYEGLHDFDYRGRITFSGMSEPLLHNNFIELITPIKRILPHIDRLQVITNGDVLTALVYEQLLEAGVDRLEINLYDGQWQVDKFSELLNGYEKKYIFRHHYHGPEKDYGLILNNRAGAVEMGCGSKVKITSPCYLPYYKMVVDWNGDIILCPQDWLKTSNLRLNINDLTIEEIWLSDVMNDYRNKLKSGRSECTPCKTCNVAGNVAGVEAYNCF